MTTEQFDALTKRLGATTSRRSLLKGVIAAAVSGVVMRPSEGHARARIRMACARLRQPCNTTVGTPGNEVCCPRLACDTDLTCCKPANETCLQDADCCAANICRPNPAGLGARCLPPGALGDPCSEDSDCAAGLICAAATGTCLSGAGTPCRDDAQCASNICDAYSNLCVSAPLNDGQPCVASDDCASGLCCLGFCEQPIGGSCQDGGECCSRACDPYAFVCLAVPAPNGSACAENGNCQSRLCCADGVCGQGQGTACLDDPDCCAGLVCRPIDDNGRFQCLPPGIAGDRCDDSFGAGDCAIGFTCVGGFCAPGAG